MAGVDEREKDPSSVTSTRSRPPSFVNGQEDSEPRMASVL